MKKNWTKIALALGPAIMIASVAWEYASVDPEYIYLIQPWSLRGYETVHGSIIAAIGVLLLIGGLSTSMERSMKPLNSALIVGYLIVGATGFAAYFAVDTLTINLGAVQGIVISLLLANTVAIALKSLFGESNKVIKRALLTFVPLLAGFYLLINTTLVGNPLTLPTWSVVFIVLLGLGAFSLAIKPMNMGANRMLIIVTVAAWAVILLSAGAIRQSLIGLQLITDQGDDLLGIATQYKDTQAAAGWWLAGLGVSIMFFGAVGLWARRRDVVASIARAKKQRLAAEESAREIEEAAKAYALEHGEAVST